MFYNSAGKNTAILSCKNKSNFFKLYFHLSDNPVQHIWQEIHSNNKNIITGIHQGTDFNFLVQQLNLCCIEEKINLLEEPIDQKKLNDLHHQFVLHSNEPSWHKINHLIHILEGKLNNPLSEFDSSVIFFAEKEKFVPILDEYKLFLSPDVSWGKMVLGYGTLGKDWLDIASNNDINDDLSIQSTISSETRLLFCPEQVIDSYQEQKFYKWAKKTNINVPLNDLNLLSIGRYVLGQIIITDIFLNYHNNSSDWYVPNHICKFMWNKEIFTSDTKIIEINFENTDLMFETLASHTGLKNINV